MNWDAYFDIERYIFLYNPCLEGKMSWDASFDMESYPPMMNEVPFNSRKRGKVRQNPIVMKQNPIVMESHRGSRAMTS